MNRDPIFYIKTLSRSRIKPRFTESSYPRDARKLRSFEDCDWLFACHQANRGIARLDFDEAAFLFRLVRSFKAPRIIEVGRFRGGSTILMGTAGDDGTRITSIDIAPKNDALLRSVLEKAGIAHKIDLVVNDANKVPAPADTYDIVFIDGDHTYQGIKKDYEHWKKSVKPGGHILFHDAGEGRELATAREDPKRLMREIAQKDGALWQRQPDVASIASFVRTDKAWPAASESGK